MKNIYVEPKLEIKAFGIRENTNNIQDTEDLSVIGDGWPTPTDE